MTDSITKNQTVFVVDDDDDLRKSLKFLLESFRLHVKSYASAADFLDALDPHADGCAILDIRMPGMDGFELHDRLIERHTIFPVIFLTANTEVPKAVAAIKKGAMNLLLKSVSEEELVVRIFEALEYSRKIQKKNRDFIQTNNQVQSLSEREHEVMEHVVEGRLNRVIAETLEVTTKTVESHRKKMMGKMKVSSVAELIHKILEFRRNNQEQE